MSIRSLGTLTVGALGLLSFSCSSAAPAGGTGGVSGGTGGSLGSGGATGGGSGGSASGGTGGSGTGGTATGGVVGTGGSSVGTGGSSSGGHVGPGSGGSAGSAGRGSGGSAGSGSGGATATGGAGGEVATGTPMPSAGCGKTSTLTFGTVPGETATATPGGPSNGTGKGGYVKITSGGTQRGFAMRLPDNYDNNHPYPLFFAFHWNGGDSKAQDTGGDNGYFTAYYGIQRKSKNGMFFVAPDSIGSGWGNGSDSDLHFTDDMVKLISDNYCIDMSNLITSGFSWGGGMSYELACARANTKDNTAGYAFRAAIIFEGANLSNCDGSGKDPIALWQKVGLTDTTCPVSAATPIRDQFVKNNQCTGWTSETGNVAATKTGTTSQEPPRPPNPGQYINPGGHVCTNYTGCSDGHPIRWCVDQSGHGNATTDGTSSLYDECANVTSQNPMGNCSPGCPCTWTPDDIWTWLNDPTVNKYTPNTTTK
jgi:poly(3-hydroxybutyrate) depolymerase